MEDGEIWRIINGSVPSSIGLGQCPAFFKIRDSTDGYIFFDNNIQNLTEISSSLEYYSMAC